MASFTFFNFFEQINLGGGSDFYATRSVGDRRTQVTVTEKSGSADGQLRPGEVVDIDGVDFTYLGTLIFRGNLYQIFDRAGIRYNAEVNSPLSSGNTVYHVSQVDVSKAWTPSGLVTISPDGAGEVSVASATISEGDSGTTNLTFTITRTGGTSAFNVTATASDGSATAGSGDYQAFSQVVSFAANENSKTVTIAVNGDRNVEVNETLQLALSAPTNGATISATAGTATGTIVNDDVSGTVSIANAQVSEGDSGTTNLTFTITRTGGTAPFAVTATTSDGTATTGNADYRSFSQVVNFAALETSKTVTITVNGDTIVEGNETLQLTLSSATNGATISATAGTATGTIVNDDASGSVSIANAQVSEGDNGTTNLTFTITRTGGTAPFTVNYATQDLPGGATAGTDYTGTAGTVTFAANETVKTVTVKVSGDTTNEANENFQVDLSGATNGATIVQGGGSGVGTATGTILNDDATFVLSAASVTEGTGGVTLMPVSVSRDPAFSQFATTLYVSTASGTAVMGSDFAPGPYRVDLAAGQSSAVIYMIITADNVIETNEMFSVALYEDMGLSQMMSQTSVTIFDDDGLSSLNAFGSGNDVLRAVGGGAETLEGGKGDDQYLVDSIDDVVIEGPDSGYDTVFTNVSYTLNGGSFVESLSTQTHSGTDPINLIGNFHDQLIIGNFGNNVLNGNGGVDTLIGLFGDDVYVVGNAAAQIIEADGQGFDVAFAGTSYALGAGVSVEVLASQTAADTAAMNLSGNAFAQTVIGNAGANVLDGGAGSDTLVGLGGADTFAFSTAPGAGNVDTIQDFSAAQGDTIQLAASIFAGLGAGTLSASAFTTGTAATTAEHRIVYDQATGALFYDADGSGAGAAVQFAQLAPGTELTAANMVVV